MSDIAVEAVSVSKKFRRGESFDSLRDFIPAVFGRALRAATSGSLRKDEFWALKDLSFRVERGEALGVVGHNGAGKSTLLKILSRIMMPTSGIVRVNGRLSALIEVGAGFHPDLTGRENITLSGVILGMARADIRRKFDEIVDFSGLEEFLDTPLKRYSTGMYARLGFAVAAHMDPEILLVDEVLSVGDWAYQARCTQKMEELLRSGASVLFVSHNLRALASLCTSAILLENGCLTRTGASEDVIRFYLESSQQARDPTKSKTVAISGVTVSLPGERDGVRFSSGEEVFATVAIRSAITCRNLAVHLYIYDSNFYNVFQTSTELLGCENLSMCEGEQKTFTFVLTLNLGRGLYYVGAVTRGRFQGGLEQYDRRFPGATIYVEGPDSANGPANLQPKLASMAPR